MNNSAFRDPDEGLNLDERVKLISMTLQGLRERPCQQQQRMSDAGSQSLAGLRADSPAPHVVLPTQKQMEVEQQKSEPPDSLPYRIESSTIICVERRPSEDVLEDHPNKRVKLELPPPQKRPNTRLISYSEAEVLAEDIELHGDLPADLEDNNSHKLQYQQLCRTFENKSMEVDALVESNRALQERSVEMELRLLKEKVATRKLIRNLTEELWRYERLEELEHSNSFVAAERNRQANEYLQELQQAISELKTKKVRRTKSMKQPKEAVEPTSNILDYYDKDKMGFVADLTKKLETELTVLERERSRRKEHQELHERLLKAPSLLRPQDHDCLVLFERFAVRRYSFVLDEEEHYECFDFESLSNVQIKVINIEQFDSKRKPETMLLLREATERTLTANHTALLKNIAAYAYGDNHLIVVRDYFRGSTLREMSVKYDGVSEAMIKHIVKVVAAGMLQARTKLGSEDIAHPNAIFIDKSKRQCYAADIRLASYGLPHLFNSKYAELRHFYYPPEFWRNGSAEKLATWSLAVTFFECFYGKRPFVYELEDVKSFQFHEQPDFPVKPTLSEQAKTLLRQCLTAGGGARIDLAIFLRHDYFNQK